MVSVISTLLVFVVALIVSTIIIYVVTKLFGETEDIKTAVITALVGTIIYTIIYFLLGNGLISGFIAGIAWLLVLQHFYSIGWIKSLLIAIVVWIVTSVVGMFLPVL
jgi:type IV secretory pathway VirB6-like protein